MLYAGIDEAGYGPVLGPLCVGFTAFDVPDVGDDEPSPDLWKRLAGAVTRGVAGAASRGLKVAVNDSKKLKGSNSLKSRHPLTHLERGVLAFLHAASGGGEGATVHDDSGLMARLGVVLQEPAWYGGEAAALPVSTTTEHVGLLSAQVAGACGRAGVRVLELRCHAMAETEFNRRLRATGPLDAGEEAPGRLGSKAAVSFGVVAGFLRRVWLSRACAESSQRAASPRVVVDRQGGRTGYGPVLDAVFPDALVTVVGESTNKSVYRLDGLGEAAGRSMRVCFQTEGDGSHLPVALASMTAKLVRELAMARFNRYWCGRIAELKPTAGYALDGARWLRDVRGRVEVAELGMLRRLA